jgi:hypothetical protein
LLVQDTTEIDVTRPEQQVAGAGPLDGDSRRGALLHLMHDFATCWQLFGPDAQSDP